MKKTNFLEKNYNNFINSFKNINLNIVFMVFYDLLFYSISALIVFLGFKNIAKRAIAVNLPSNLLGLGVQQAESLLSTIKGFFFILISTLILIYLLLILNWSLFKGLNWSIANKKKFNLDFFKKFSLLNAVWLTFWILLLYFALTGIKQSAIPYFALTILAIAIYLTIILYALFTQESSIKSIKRTFNLAFTKIHYFILPYAVIISFFLIISKLFNLINLPQTTYLAVSLLAFTTIIAWSRLYIVEVVKSIK